MSVDDSAHEVGSQELPLSQETLTYGLDTIPSFLRDMLFSDNFNNSLHPAEANLVQGTMTEDNTSLPLTAIPISSQPQSSLPSMEDFPGFFNLTVTVPTNEISSKNSTYVYSSLLKRLYVRRDSPCPFNFYVNQHLGDLIEPSFIRVTLYYTSAVNINKAVRRCINHKLPDSEKGDAFYEHIIRSESQWAQYFQDSVTNRCSVLVPFDKPPAGQDFSTYVYKFLCFTSCSGGPNRRPMCAVFTLENKNQVMGRRKIDVRVCSCPFRDRTIDESRLTNENAMSQMSSIRDMPVSTDSSLSDITNDCRPVAKSSKRKKEEDSSSGEEKEFIIKVQNEELYKLLKGLKVWFQIIEASKSMQHNWVPTVNDAKNLLNALTSNSESEEK